MEYLMTYGWAILVVMVVGVAMWQLGFFNMGGSLPPTSSGFAVLKPILTTCMLKNGLYTDMPNFNGSTCMFVSSVDNIQVSGLNITLNNEHCIDGGVLTGQNPDIGAAPFSELFQLCSFPLYDPCFYSCQQSPGRTDCKNGNLNIQKDGIYSVEMHNNGFGDPNMICNQIIPGQKYQIFIDITYLESIGGVTSTKHDTGTIYITAT